MSNPYFRFKQFTVFHDRCAMKVGTDGVLVGAWADTRNAKRILDIGTGTGLIALMLAQRSQAQIDAVDIDEDACVQAKENVARSPWSDRIQIYHCSIQNYAATCQQGYDLIVSNPPFFENSSKALKRARTVARHSDLLTQVDILQIAQELLYEDGRLVVIYPCEEAKAFQEKAELFGFFCSKKLYIKPTQESQVKRILLEFNKIQLLNQEKTIVIELAKHLYSPEFVALIKNFYLKY